MRREVANLIKKNTHTQLYTVSKLWLSVTKFDPDYFKTGGIELSSFHCNIVIVIDDIKPCLLNMLFIVLVINTLGF